MKSRNQIFVLKKLEKYGPENEEITIFLVQLQNELNLEENISKKWERINKILKFVATKEFNFLVFPELAIPQIYINKILSFIKSKFPTNSTTIFGTEIITVRECNNIIRNLTIKDKHPKALLENELQEKKVNLCLIVFKKNQGKIASFAQFKLAPSKFEGSIEIEREIVNSNYIYCFKLRIVNFIVLICSDFFQRRPGIQQKIIDEIANEIMKNDISIDFIFNIQYNRSPDHEFFLNSLRKIYDDGYNFKKNICTIFLNSVGAQDYTGGLSKILFDSSKKIQEKQPIKQIDAPVLGYEFSTDEQLIYLHFKRLPKSWDNGKDSFPINYWSKTFNNVNNEWVNISEKIKYVFPLEKQSFLDSETYIELSKKLSNLGKHNESIDWAKKALKECEKGRELIHIVEILHFIGNQYRHQGRFNEALKYYYQASSFLYENNLLSFNPDFKLIVNYLRVEASINMVINYLQKGKLSDACSKYAELIIECDRLTNNMNLTDKEKKEYELYKIHAIRQKAEMIRLMGKYREAEELFNEAFNKYKYYFVEEKTYCILGVADSLRMQERFDESQIKFKEVLEFAEKTNNKRLLVIAVRKIAEINRILENEEVNNFLNILKKLSYESNNFFGKVYLKLISGGLSLKKDPVQAEEYFNLSKIEHEKCSDIRNYKIEFAHAKFGEAEAKRFQREFDKAKNLYMEAKELYIEMEMNWGIENATKGLKALENNEQFQNETYFLNIP